MERFEFATNEKLRRTSKVATANRVYRANFQRNLLYRKLPDRFTIHDAMDVMSDVGLRDSRGIDTEPVEVTRNIANCRLRDMRRRGMVKFVGPIGYRAEGFWEKVK